MKEKSDTMTTRVCLESYTVMAKHGAFDHEHEKEQPFIFSIWVTLFEDVELDDLSKTVDYGDLQRTVVKNVVEAKPVRLMETLAANIIDDISKNPLIEMIEIRIEKPDAPLPFEGGLPLVERIWTR